MKKQQIAAAACLVAGAIGFAAVYSTHNLHTEKDTTAREGREGYRDRNKAG